MVLLSIAEIHGQEGCADPYACNFDEEVVIDNGICFYPSMYDVGMMFIPDDQTDCLESTIGITAANMGDDILSADDMLLVGVNMEHSSLGDLTLTVICPNGQFTELHSGGDFGVFLGEPVDDDTDVPGIPYEYWWSPNASLGTWEVESDGLTTLPSGIYSASGTWQDLVGCPVHGIWTVEVCDLAAIDNGFVFYTSIALAEGLVDIECLGETSILGCMDDQACNYAEQATFDDGSCLYDCLGCTDPVACNFDPESLIDDGSCEFAEEFYDCDENCLSDIDGDEICDELEVEGCTDPEACNYNPFPEIDDGSCLIPGCIDPLACNYIEEAGCDDGSCIYPGFYNNDFAFIPDDQTQCYGPTLDIDEAEPPDMILTATDIVNVGINLEHSFMGDLTITLICPSGQDLILHNQGGEGTWLGEPIDDESDQPGVGYEYFWSPGAVLGTWEEESANYGTLPAGTYSAYSNWSNLIGCPVNGIWEFEICDLWGADNGFAFGTSIDFAEDVVSIDCDSTLIEGCLDPEACNYAFYATVDDGSCEYVELYQINGNLEPEQFTTETYSYPFTTNSSYLWEAVNGDIDDGQGTNVVEVIWGDVGFGSISVVETTDDNCEGDLVKEDVIIVEAVSISESSLKILIAPNPATGTVYIESSEAFLSLLIRDHSGREVLNPSFGAIHRVAIDISSLASGAYFVEVTSSEGKSTRKLIVQNP